jgi:primary-amine oxidase
LQREGLTLHDITYDGRSAFYRLSLSEMFVPYGDSRAPYPRKAAFDLGSNGAGVNANNLKLGTYSVCPSPAAAVRTYDSRRGS